MDIQTFSGDFSHLFRIIKILIFKFFVFDADFCFDPVHLTSDKYLFWVTSVTKITIYFHKVQAHFLSLNFFFFFFYQVSAALCGKIRMNFLQCHSFTNSLTCMDMSWFLSLIKRFHYVFIITCSKIMCPVPSPPVHFPKFCSSSVVFSTKTYQARAICTSTWRYDRESPAR